MRGNDHHLQVGRAISAVNRVVHGSLLPAFPCVEFVGLIDKQVQRLGTGNVGIGLLVPQIRSQGSEKT